MPNADVIKATFGPKPIAGAYSYRNLMGMMPSSDYLVLFDDFHGPVSSNTPNGWSSSVADTGGSTVTNTTAAIGASGVLTLTSDDVSEGAAFWGAKSIQLTAAKKFFMECRVRCDDVTDNTFQFGLSALTAIVNPEDIWTTVASDLVAFGILDHATTGSTLKMLADKSNSGSTVENGSRVMVVDTWHTLAIHYTGLDLLGYVDGKKALQWSQVASTIPTGVALAPFVGCLNGNGAGGNLNFVDFVRLVLER